MLPGEIGFQVLDENGKPLGHTDTLADPDSVTKANEPLWWQSAWGSVVDGRQARGRPGGPAAAGHQIRAPKVPKDKR